MGRDFCIKRRLLNIINKSIYWVSFFDCSTIDNIGLAIFSSCTKDLDNGKFVMTWGLHFHKCPRVKGLDHTKPSHIHDLDDMAMNGHALRRQEGEEQEPWVGLSPPGSLQKDENLPWNRSKAANFKAIRAGFSELSVKQMSLKANLTFSPKHLIPREAEN